MKTENISRKLKIQNRWVLWRKEKRENKDESIEETKTPYGLYGHKASTAKSSTWSSFNEVINRVDSYDGVGFVLGEGWTGVDFDHCYDPQTSEYKNPVVKEVIDSLPGYKEFSPSGDGVHVIFRKNDLLENEDFQEIKKIYSKSAKTGFKEVFDDGIAMEFYWDRRYFTVTGNTIENQSDPIMGFDCDVIVDGLKKIADHYGIVAQKEEAKTKHQNIINNITLDDQEVIEKATNGQSGSNFQNLYNGNWENVVGSDGSNFNSQSSADLSFLNHLAYWTAKDSAQMRRIFMGSGLYRESKGENYLNLTIEKAVMDCNNVYIPNNKANKQPQPTQPKNVITQPKNNNQSETEMIKEFEELKKQHINAKETKEKTKIFFDICDLLARLELMKADKSVISAFIDELKKDCNIQKGNTRENIADSKRKYKNAVKKLKNKDTKDELELQSLISKTKACPDEATRNYGVLVKKYVRNPKSNDDSLEEILDIHARKENQNNVTILMELIASKFPKVSDLGVGQYKKLLKSRQEQIKQEEQTDRYGDIEPPEPDDIMKENLVWTHDKNGDQRSMAIVVDQAYKIICKENREHPVIFRRGNTFSTILVNDEEIYSIEVCNSARLRYEMSKYCTWLMVKSTKDGPIISPTNPKKDHSDMLFSMDAGGLYPLRGLANHPILNEDGSIDNNPGYNKESGYYIPEGNTVDLIEDMTLDEAKYHLWDLFGELPWSNEKDFINMLSIGLTLLMRPIIDGPTPIHAVIAEAECGKSLLADTISYVIMGMPSRARQVPYFGDEWRKKLLADLSEGQELLYYDNLKNPTKQIDGEEVEVELDASSLASTITAPYFSDRILGSSKNASFKVNCTWLITMHSLVMTRELERRCLRIEMSIAKRQARKEPFKYTNLCKHALNNRSLYLSAFFTLIRNWFEKEQPLGTNLLNSFEDWSEKIGGVLGAAGYEGFMKPPKPDTEYANAISLDTNDKIVSFLKENVEKGVDCYITSEDLYDQINTILDENSRIDEKNPVIDDIVYETFEIMLSATVIDDKERWVYKYLKWKEI